MDIAVTTAHRAKHGTQIRPHSVNHRFAKRQPSGRVADQRREHVALFQRQTYGNAQGFLPAADKNAAMDFPGAVKRGEFSSSRRASSMKRYAARCLLRPVAISLIGSG